MYGDTTAIRALSRRLEEQAVDIGNEADALVALAEACPWTGWAADAMRRRARERAAALRRTGDLHHAAAHALARHAAEVDAVKHLVAAVERKVRQALDEAGDLFARVVLPPPGHRGWLQLELPSQLRAVPGLRDLTA